MPKFQKSDGFQMKRGSNPTFKHLGSANPQPGDSPVEKFDWGAALSGGAKGAKAGSMLGPWGAAIGGVGMGIMAGIKGGKAQEDQEAADELALKTEKEKDELLMAAKKKSERESVGYSGFDEAQST